MSPQEELLRKAATYLRNPGDSEIRDLAIMHVIWHWSEIYGGSPDATRQTECLSDQEVVKFYEDCVVAEHNIRQALWDFELRELALSGRSLDEQFEYLKSKGRILDIGDL